MEVFLKILPFEECVNNEIRFLSIILVLVHCLDRLDSAPTAILQQDGVECNYMELIEYFQKKINLVICNKVKYNCRLFTIENMNFISVWKMGLPLKISYKFQIGLISFATWRTQIWSLCIGGNWIGHRKKRIKGG